MNEETIQLDYCGTEEQMADIMTKGVKLKEEWECTLRKNKLERSCSSLGEGEE